MTKSTSERSSRDVLDVRRPLAAAASSFEILPLPTSFSSSLSANLRPLSMDAWELSISRTGTEAFCAATSAIPRPCSGQSLFSEAHERQTICPAPITPSFLTSAAAPTEGVELKERHCREAAHLTACLDAEENIASTLTLCGKVRCKGQQLFTHVKLPRLGTDG